MRRVLLRRTVRPTTLVVVKIMATADLHGSLPDIPVCDLLLVGGDVCPLEDHSLERQYEWLDTEFREWLLKVPAKRIVGIAGNHDYVFEKMRPSVDELHLPWTYLQDEEVTIDGLRIYGTPWVPNLPRWAFYGGPHSRVTMTKIENIPAGLDILMSHGPMDGYGDLSIFYGEPGEHVGCRNMASEMHRLSPKLFVCGHIHEGYGHYRHPDIEHGVYNVAHNTIGYEPINPPVEVMA